MNKKLCRYIATSLVFALLLAVPSFAASHYTGNQYASYGSGRVGVEAYIYYSTNTSSSIYITSSVIFVRNEVPFTAGPVNFSVSEQPASTSYSYNSYVSIPSGDLQRVEKAVNRSFSKTTGTNGYVFCQSYVQIDSVPCGWDTFCYPNSFSSSFHS